MCLDRSITTINAMLQLLNIYRYRWFLELSRVILCYLLGKKRSNKAWKHHQTVEILPLHNCNLFICWDKFWFKERWKGKFELVTFAIWSVVPSWLCYSLGCNLFNSKYKNIGYEFSWLLSCFHSSECIAATEICMRSYDTLQPLQLALV